MSIYRIWKVAILFCLTSCSDRVETTTEINRVETDTTSVDTTMVSSNEIGVIVPDSIERLIVDDYPVTNEMLNAQAGVNSYFKLSSGKTISFDQAWFTNDSLGQTLVIALATDYHRCLTFHFINNDIPVDMIEQMELHSEGGKLASEAQKQSDFDGFIKQSTEIDSRYLVTDKSVRLGYTKEHAIELYGKPDKYSITNRIEKLEWKYVGDEVYDGKEDLKGRPLAKESFGHGVDMYFRNGRLIGQILFNDVL